jgi:hypothetical protein
MMQERRQCYSRVESVAWWRAGFCPAKWFRPDDIETDTIQEQI